MSFIPIFDAIKPVIDKALSFIPDPVQKAEQEKFIITALQSWDAQQAAINLEEAKNEHIFVSGWRPFMGWCCGGAFAYKFIIQPFLVFALVATGSKFDYHMLPMLDWSEMSTVLLGLLGLGGMRSLEKIKGV